jgi:hypothetical protein
MNDLNQNVVDSADAMPLVAANPYGLGDNITFMFSLMAEFGLLPAPLFS